MGVTSFPIDRQVDWISWFILLRLCLDMGRPTPKKKTSGTSVKDSGSILSFFSKAPTEKERQTNQGVKAEPRISDASSSTALRRASSTASRKGKEKAVAVAGNEDDPVVISDDDMDGVKPVVGRTVLAGNGKRRKVSPPPVIPKSEIVDIPSSPVAGPSRSCSPPPPPTDIEKRPVIAGLSDFVPPKTWPEIVNTGQDPDDDDDDDDSIAGRDYDHVLESSSDEDEVQPCDGQDGVTAALDLEEAEEIVPLDQPPGPRQPSPTGSIGLNMGGLNLDMEWGEDMDEGMGMEDFGAEEGDEMPEEVIGKRKKGAKGKGKGEKEGDSCPVCGQSMNGKASKVSLPTCYLPGPFDV